LRECAGGHGNCGRCPSEALESSSPATARAEALEVAEENLSTSIVVVTEKDAEGRVFVSTYPTMMGLITNRRRAAPFPGSGTSIWSSSTRLTDRLFQK